MPDTHPLKVDVIGKDFETPRMNAFLNTSISDPAAFSKALLAAAIEIRAQEIGLSYGQVLFRGDNSALKKLSPKSLSFASMAFNDVDEGHEHHAKIAAQEWERAGSATFFRGTRLPESVGSFGFGCQECRGEMLLRPLSCLGPQAMVGQGMSFNVVWVDLSQTKYSAQAGWPPWRM